MSTTSLTRPQIDRGVPVPLNQLLDASAVRARCGGVTRTTMARWREEGFPAPLPVPHVTAALWLRGDVDAWWQERNRTR